MSSTPRVAQKTDPSFRFGMVAGRMRSGGECAVKVRRVEHLRYGTLLMPDPGALPTWLTKAIPAALVMATTHSILRGDAPTFVSPGAVLERANGRLYPDIPAHMFVTCLYAVLDPESGRLRYANAGHNLPHFATADGVTELRATGMPLGAMLGMTYEENEVYLAPGDSILLHSAGLAEAHDPTGEMFGFPRFQKVVENSSGSEHLIDECLTELREFAGRDWEQEDDITLVTLERTTSPSSSVTITEVASEQGHPPEHDHRMALRPVSWMTKTEV
jgi:hypothetical protein